MDPEISLDELFYGSSIIGERGQIVVPAEARRKYDMHPGDKVLVFGLHRGHGILVCKIDDLRKMFSTLQSSLENIESLMAEEQS